jgi:SAM-dependent methyltransferase
MGETNNEKDHLKISLISSPPSATFRPMEQPPFSPFYSKHFHATYATPPPDEFNRLLLLAQATNGPILEPMCGAGRYLVPLHQHRSNTEGLDACPYMLDLCRSRTNATLYRQKIEEMTLPRRYGMIYITMKSLCMLDSTTLPLVFRNIRRYLTPNGRFIFDLWSLTSTHFPPTHQTRYRIQGLDIEEEFVFDPTSQRLLTTTRYGGAEDRMQIQLYEKKEILRLLERSGFILTQATDHRCLAKLGDRVVSKESFWLECAPSPM